MVAAFLEALRNMSGTIFLRLVPLLGTTAALNLSFGEYFFLSDFLLPSVRPFLAGGKLRLFQRSFYRDTIAVALLYAVSAVTSFVNAYGLTKLNAGQSSKYYWAGMAFVLGHFAFVPIVRRNILKAMETDQSEADSASALRTCLRTHLWRGVLVDLPACAMSLVAVMVWCNEGCPL